MRPLRKAEVESLLAGYDADPVGALTLALRAITGHVGWSWVDLVGELPPERHVSLLALDEHALDALAADLNELRTLPPR